MNSINLNKKPEESDLAYIRRIGQAKDNGLLDMTWTQLAEIFNNNLRKHGEAWAESTYRKKYASMRNFSEEFGDVIDNTDSEELIKLRRELEKEKVKIRDERNEYRKLIREEARKESYKEQFIKSIEETAGKHPLDYNSNIDKIIIRGNTTLVVPLTDIHCGIKVHNNWNTFNEDILRQMLKYYLDRIIEIAVKNGSENVIVLGSELVSGNIHNNLRLQNNQDLIDQFLLATDYICDFLTTLSYCFNSVEFYVAPGNHGRIMQNKKDSLEHENIENLVVPYVKSKLQNFTNIKCYDNEIDQGIVIVSIYNQKLVFVHGDLDTMDNVTKNMTKLLGYIPDIIVIGHRHFNAFTTDGETKVIQSGSFVGTDEYALSKRLVGKAEQSPFIISPENGLECIYNVKFD